MRPLEGILIKMNLNKFDINDAQLLNKFELKGKEVSNMYMCTFVHMYICKYVHA